MTDPLEQQLKPCPGRNHCNGIAYSVGGKVAGPCHRCVPDAVQAERERIAREIDERIDAGRGASEAWPEAMALDWCKRNIVLRVPEHGLKPLLCASCASAHHNRCEGCSCECNDAAGPITEGTLKECRCIKADTDDGVHNADCPRRREGRLSDITPVPPGAYYVQTPFGWATPNVEPRSGVCRNGRHALCSEDPEGDCACPCHAARQDGLSRRLSANTDPNRVEVCDHTQMSTSVDNKTPIDHEGEQSPQLADGPGTNASGSNADVSADIATLDPQMPDVGVSQYDESTRPENVYTSDAIIDTRKVELADSDEKDKL